MFAIATAIAIAIALAGCSPREFADLAYEIERLPGQRLGGTEQPVPADFDFVNHWDHDLVQLKVSGDLLPYVVNTRAVAIGDSVYVWTAPSTGWSRRIEKRPDVWLRAGDAVYPLRANRVEIPEHRQRIFEAFMAKYDKEVRKMFQGLEPGIEQSDIVYRLAPRS